MYPSVYKMTVGDKTLHDNNFAFLTTSLAKMHAQTYAPIHWVTYGQDIHLNLGGGFVDYVSYYTVDWTLISNQTENLFGNQANIIPRINAAMYQERVRVFTFEMAYDLKFIELEKMKTLQMAKSIEEIYRDGIIVAFDLFAQEILYLGNKTAKTHGFFNNPNMKVYIVPTGEKGTTNIADMTDEEVMSFFNGIFSTYLSETNWNIAMLPDTFLMAPTQAVALSNRFSPFYTQNLRNFILKNNYGVDEAVSSTQASTYTFSIRSRPDLETVGTGGVPRTLVYRNVPEFVRADIPFSIQQFFTGPNVDRAAYTTYWVAQISGVQLPYTDGFPDRFGPVNAWDHL